MKALKLSTICAFLLILSACTRDVDTLSTSSSSLSETSEAQLSNNKPATVGGGQVQGGTVNALSNDKKPVLTPTQFPATYTLGATGGVTITYTATDANTQVACGRVSIYQRVNGGSWTEVAHAAAPVVSYTFTPANATDCYYEFRAGFDPGGNPTQCRGAYSGVDYLTESTTFCADVEEPCVETFDIQKSATASDNGDGTYNFTITFTLTSPEDVEGVKFQGGATSGGQDKHDMLSMENLVVVNDNKQNTVLAWEGNLEKCKPQTVSFTYKRKFACPATDVLVTGSWTAKQGETLLADPVQVTYSCN